MQNLFGETIRPVSEGDVATLLRLVDDYHRFMRTNTLVGEPLPGGWLPISTPYLDVYNDAIEIYAKLEGEKILLSDDGQTLRNLESYGASLNRSPKRQDILQGVLLNYGIGLQSSELVAEATKATFPQKKHNLVSAISELNDVSFLAEQHGGAAFREEVQAYLDALEIAYTPSFISVGSSGLNFTFDFQIAYRHTEILIRALPSLSKINVPNFLYAWKDVRAMREKLTHKKIVGLAVINDAPGVKEEFIEALRREEAQSILWSRRDHTENLLKLKMGLV